MDDSVQGLLDKGVRKEVVDFAVEMEKVLRQHDLKKGDSWKTCKFNFLVGKLEEEVEELNNWWLYSPYTNDLGSELIDIANVCMMMWNRKDEEVE